MSEYFIALILAAGHWLEMHWFTWSSAVTRRLSVSEAAAPAGWRLWLVGCSLFHPDLSLGHDSKCHRWTQEASTTATHWISCFFPQLLHCTHSRSTCSPSWSSLAPLFRISKWSNSCMFLIVLLKQLWWLGKQRGKVEFLFSGLLLKSTCLLTSFSKQTSPNRLTPAVWYAQVELLKSTANNHAFTDI